MYLRHLEITQVRNLQPVSIDPHPSINFILGPNGSGKTSFLEGIACLSNGRSFRTTDAKKLIQYGARELVVFGEVQSEQSGLVRLGINKDVAGNTLVRIDGVNQNRLSALARVLPTVSLDTNSLEIVEGGPAHRRSILDWGMFHVEHSYLEIWSNYRNALKQKNALLKRGVSGSDKHYLRNWNQTLARYGQRIHEQRSIYSELLSHYLARTVEQFFHVDVPMELRYRAGWNTDDYAELEVCLQVKMDSEIERSSCLYGPHRCELEVLWDGRLAKDICSRGQKKLVLYAVRLAQIALMIEKIGVAPLLLLDDLPAELDEKNINNVIGFLKEFPCQTFITAISEQSITESVLAAFAEHSMFHVEHGTLHQIR